MLGKLKVAKSQKVFHFRSYVQNKAPNNSLEHLLIMWIVLQGMIWHLFGDLSKNEKLYDIKPEPFVICVDS